jgi:hypothetical protein
LSTSNEPRGFSDLFTYVDERTDEIRQEVIDMMSPAVRECFDFLNSLSEEKSARIAEVCRETGLIESEIVDLFGQERIMRDDF